MPFQSAKVLVILSVVKSKPWTFINQRKELWHKNITGYFVWKFLVVSVAAKISLKFKGSTTTIPQNRSKLPLKALLRLWIGFVWYTYPLI